MTAEDRPVAQAFDPLAERARSWNAYWSSGALHSCVGSFGGNYAGEVREFWRTLATSLPVGARLLDVATGNGALPALFIEDVPDERQLRIDAVDLADVQPAWLASAPAAARERTRFHPGVRAEDLRSPMPASTSPSASSGWSTPTPRVRCPSCAASCAPAAGWRWCCTPASR